MWFGGEVARRRRRLEIRLRKQRAEARLQEDEQHAEVLREVQHITPRTLSPDEHFTREKAEILTIQARLQSNITLATFSLLGLCILGASTYTYFSVRDVLPNSATIGLLLLISFIAGLGTILYGVVQSRMIIRSAWHQSTLQQFESWIAAQRREEKRSLLQEGHTGANAEATDHFA